MAQNVDARVRRTRELIRDAFMELIVEQGFDNVTVQAIAARAQINRATFYRHYTDKFDLAARLTDLLFADVAAQLESSSADAPLANWQLLFEHVAHYAPFYRAMLGKGGIPGFPERVRETVEAQMTAFLPAWGFTETRLQMPLSLAVRYLAAAQVGLIQWWLENDMPYPPEQAARYLVDLHLRGGMWALGFSAERLECGAVTSRASR
jgi:AcrR family transcriptional regulator